MVLLQTQELVGSSGGDWSTTYGYLPNGSKSHVLAKPHHVEAAKEIFKGTGIVISTEGERYLGGALGTPLLVCQYIKRKVEC